MVFQHIVSFSSVRDQPTFSFLVLRNVNKFAGPCETSPGCFDSSHSCTVPVTQVSGLWFPAWCGGGGVRVSLNSHRGTRTLTGVREGPNNSALLCGWEMQSPNFLGPRQPDNCQLLLDAIFTPLRKLVLQKYFLTWRLWWKWCWPKVDCGTWRHFPKTDLSDLWAKMLILITFTIWTLKCKVLTEARRIGKELPYLSGSWSSVFSVCVLSPDSEAQQEAELRKERTGYWRSGTSFLAERRKLGLL